MQQVTILLQRSRVHIPSPALIYVLKEEKQYAIWALAGINF